MSEEAPAGAGESSCVGGDGNHHGSFGNVAGGGSGLNQHLTWDHYKADQWSPLLNGCLQTL